ncbi:S8 family peptidase [Solimonas terrae]|uniref:S8 family peptidase n=1 Tax=Solimonas terrae TaxID=1396819 RepID=A0A6M2BQ26_9GAMM|nr:S8 family peptidase [Solimonas terrae]NGY04177.1 S8 family peptidase [Solimonas terrae]
MGSKGRALRHVAAGIILGSMFVNAHAAASQAISDQYIVELNTPAIGTREHGLGIAALAQSLLVKVGGGQVFAQYDHALLGFAVRLSANQAAALAKLPGVRRVEPDRVMTASATESGATWGLDRVDQTALPLDGLYRYPDNGGQNVNIYVIDTGITATHTEFTGRIGNGQNFAPNSNGLLGGLLGGLLPISLPSLGGLFGGNTDPNDTTDCNGHGTHVSGTAAGTVYGIAKKATIHPVRVLGCSGSGATSGVIAGIDWVAANRVLPAVANMSLGGSDSATLDDAVDSAIAQGVTFVVAAGNSNADACSGSPNKVPDAITVGATTNADSRDTSYSNYGSCVDIFAPGTNITSAWDTSDTATNTISGTSMATPHVTGAVALLLGANPGLNPAQVTDELLGDATLGVLSNVGSGSPNALLYVRH